MRATHVNGVPASSPQRTPPFASRLQDWLCKARHMISALKNDVAGWMRLENRLRESEDRFRQLASMSSDWFWEQDANLRFTRIYGDEHIRHGVPHEQFIGKTRWEIRYAGLTDEQVRNHNAVLAARQPFRNLEYQRIGSDGKRYYRSISGEPVFDIQGRFKGYIGTARDVTGMRRAEALLNREKQVLEMIAGDASLTAILETIARSVEALSPGVLCSILLLDADGVHLRHGAAPSLPEDYNRAVDGLAIGPKAGSCGTAAYCNRSIVVTNIAADPLWSDWRALALRHGLHACWSVPVRAHGTRPLGSFAVYYREQRAPAPDEFELVERMTHLTGIAIERKQAHDVLRRQALIFDNAIDAIVVVDCQRRIIDWNPAAERLFGYRKDEVLGQTGRFMVPDGEYEQYGKLIDDAIERDRRWTGQRVLLRKDGAQVTCESVRVPLLDQDGRLIGRLGVNRDITDRSKAEEALQISRRQLRALAARLHTVREAETAVLSREIHDELGQALTALNMDLSWLASRLPADAPALAAKAGSMALLVDATIQTVRDITGRLRPRMLDDLGLVAAIEWQARDFQNHTGIPCELVADMDNAGPKLGPERSTVVFRIVQESLTNVVRHAGATRVDIALHEESDCLALEIRDNGCGIRADEIAGTQSLGLIGMRERALVFGGELTVAGFPGRGTVVTLHIPISAQ
jgi:PAS domain S-box-containing protein